jgi:hypothetical protein
MLFQVVGSTFDLMETYAAAWQKISGSEPVPSFGFQYAVGLEPVNVNLERMLHNFRLGVNELTDLWQAILPGDIIAALEQASRQPLERFRIPEELWVETIHHFAAVAYRNIINREHLLKSLTPLYIGRTASFVLETQESDADAVEEKIEALCRIFEGKKSQLLASWK